MQERIDRIIGWLEQVVDKEMAEGPGRDEEDIMVLVSTLNTLARFYALRGGNK